MSDREAVKGAAAEIASMITDFLRKGYGPPIESPTFLAQIIEKYVLRGARDES